MKIVYNRFLPFRGYSVINLFGVLFVRKNPDGSITEPTEVTLNHERIHTAQMKELLFVGFYLWYGLEYLFIRLLHRKQVCAYMDVSFEEEAHGNECNLNYLQSRRHFAWTEHLRSRSNHTDTRQGCR